MIHGFASLPQQDALSVLHDGRAGAWALSRLLLMGTHKHCTYTLHSCTPINRLGERSNENLELPENQNFLFLSPVAFCCPGVSLTLPSSTFKTPHVIGSAMASSMLGCMPPDWEEHLKASMISSTPATG